MRLLWAVNEFVIAQNVSGALHLFLDALHHESAYQTRAATHL